MQPLPVVAALPRRAAELQAHRSFCCCQAIVRTAKLPRGWTDSISLLYRSLACFLSFCLKALAVVLFHFDLSLHPSFSHLLHLCFLSFLSNTHHLLSSHTLLGSFIIEQGCFIHFVFNLYFFCNLTTGL